MTRIANGSGCRRNDREGCAQLPAGVRADPLTSVQQAGLLYYNSVGYVDPCWTPRFPSSCSAATQVDAGSKAVRAAVLPEREVRLAGNEPNDQQAGGAGTLLMLSAAKGARYSLLVLKHILLGWIGGKEWRCTLHPQNTCLAREGYGSPTSTIASWAEGRAISICLRHGIGLLDLLISLIVESGLWFWPQMRWGGKESSLHPSCFGALSGGLLYASSRDTVGSTPGRRWYSLRNVVEQLRQVSSSMRLTKTHIHPETKPPCRVLLHAVDVWLTLTGGPCNLGLHVFLDWKLTNSQKWSNHEDSYQFSVDFGPTS